MAPWRCRRQGIERNVHRLGGSKGGPKGCFDLASGLSNCCWSTDYGTVLISTVFNQVRYQRPAILSLGSRRQEHPIQGPPRLRMEIEASLGYCLKKQTKQ